MSAEHEFKPIGEVLKGIEIRPLEDGETPMEVLVVVKTMDQDGETIWSERTSAGINNFETVGALVIELYRVLRVTFDGWEPDDV